MTILISDMGDTVIASFKRGTFKLADWTVLPKAGIWQDLIKAHPALVHWIQNREPKEGEKEKEKKTKGKRVPDNLLCTDTSDEASNNSNPPAPTLEDVCQLDDLDDGALARKFASAIQRTANKLNADPPKRYTYEEWAEYTRLIRFSKMDPEELEEAEAAEGLVEWDWIGADSPMLADKSESQWILDRLCESLDRFMRKQGVGNGKRAGSASGEAAAEKKDR